MITRKSFKFRILAKSSVFYLLIFNIIVYISYKKYSENTKNYEPTHKIKKLNSKKPKIVFINTPFTTFELTELPNWKKGCSPEYSVCDIKVSHSETDISTADAVVTYLLGRGFWPDDWPRTASENDIPYIEDLKKIMKPSAKLGFMSLEAPLYTNKRYEFLQKITKHVDFFISYRKESSIFYPYGHICTTLEKVQGNRDIGKSEGAIAM